MTGGAERRLRGLHVLADDAPHWKWDPLAQARAACRGGASLVQLRAKHAGDREALAWALRIRELTREAGALFVVNDRFDLALAAGADGVHLGQEDLPPARIPARLRARLLVGRSTHTPVEAAQACAEAVDYVAFGPIFASPSKPGARPARGVAALAELVRRVAPRPLVAIGGIDAARAAEVARTGAGLAVISAVAGAADPEAAVRELAACLEAARA
jgi:thiamine-phosphate pyrophosphorylase